VSWSPKQDLIATGGDDGSVRLWDGSSGKLLAELRDHRGAVYAFAWSPNGQYLASGGERSPVSNEVDNDIRIWDISERSLKYTLTGHEGFVSDIVWSPDSSTLASVSLDRTVRVWDPNSGTAISVLEGHADQTRGIGFSFDSQILASNSWDRTLRLWKSSSWEPLAIVEVVEAGKGDTIWYARVVWDPTGPRLATVSGQEILVWSLDIGILLGTRPTTGSVRYTTAKLVLVGDSGVGKTGLGWRLAHGEFKEHASTHGQQFWIVDELRTQRRDGTECEVVLWDLAGQHVYRPIHAIFLDNVDFALILFDPSNRQEPLKGVEFWLGQLAINKELPPSVLVGARVDRGTLTVSQEELQQFCQRYKISGGYVGTSAKSGVGVDMLLDLLRTQIPWERMTATVTTVTFKRIKDYVLALKEKLDRKGVLVHRPELRQQLQAFDAEWQFTDAEMMTAVRHLENHGYVTILRNASGEQTILLLPELLAGVASSIVLQADKHPHELGALNETELLRGRYSLPEVTNLEWTEQQILLEAATLRFLEHNICFRETLGADALLIFPDLIKQKRPLLNSIETTEDTSYIVRGRIENVYAALVVLLGYTQAFTRINQWQNQAQYEMGKDEICGFRLIEEREGEMELVLYYSNTMPDYGRAMFQGLFEKFLYQRDVDVTRFPPVLCPNKHRQTRVTVIRRLNEDKSFLYCDECGQRTDLPELQKPQALGAKESQIIQREVALARLRSKYEIHLANIKSFRRDRIAPRCYLSYLPSQREWAMHLARDLRDAGAYLIEDTAQIKENDFIIVLCSDGYKGAWERKAETIADDIPLIRFHLQQNAGWSTVIPLLREGELSSACPDELRGYHAGDVRDESRYAVELFDLILTLYAIPFKHPAFEPLRQSLEQQWKQTLAGFVSEKEIQAPKELKSTEIAAKENPTMNYHDFQILVTADRRIRASSEQGDAWGELHLEVNKLQLALNLVEKKQSDAPLLRNLGGELYRALLPPTIHSHLRATRAGAGVGNNVRIRLVFESPDIAALPWEFLYDESTDAFLANNTETVVSRYIDVPIQKRDLKTASLPLKVLLVISSPTNLGKLDASGEEHLIREALSNHVEAGNIELDVLTEATIRNITQKLREKLYDVFHFIGHGVFQNDQGFIALVEADGKAKLMDDRGFASFFLGKHNLGLVVLNACQGAAQSSHRAFAGVAPNLVRRGIPGVIAMQYSILDKTAKLFADEFYRTLALGWPVDAAIQTTRNAISMEVGLDKRDFATPVLYMRAKDGIILSGL
jgi:small GTP-binding protein